MKVHRVVIVDGDGDKHIRFAKGKGSAKKERLNMFEELKEFKVKKKDIEIEELEIGKGKDGLIDFLNEQIDFAFDE